MDIWILRPREDLDRGDNPWIPPYGRSFGFIVIAESEKRAREIAQKNAGLEESAARCVEEKQRIHPHREQENKPKTSTPWLDANYSSCEQLVVGTEERLVMAEYMD